MSAAQGNGIAVDSNGNTFVIGVFEPSILFDSIMLVSNGGMDLFVAKYNSQGNVIWAKSFGGSGWDSGQKIKIDNNGDLLIAGDFESSSITFGSNSLNNQGSHDVFLAKIDTSGNTLWANSIYSNLDERCQDICVDENNNLLVAAQCGYGTSLVNFDSISLANIGTNTFLAKYNAFGVAVWARGFGDSANINGLSTDRKCSIYITGEYTGECTSFDTDTLTSMGYSDIFLSKLDSLGNVIWAQSYGGVSNNDEGMCVRIDSLESIYLAGQFGSPFITFSLDTILHNGQVPYKDVFCVKLDSLRNPIWTSSFGGWNNDYVYDMDIDQYNNLFLTGGLSFSLLNAFLAKYDSLGVLDWIKTSGGDMGDRGHGVASSNDGSTYITGVFIPPTNFDAYSLPSSNWGSLQNFFIAKTDTVCGLSISVSNESICFGDTTTIIANGATNYTWSTGSVGSTISVSPLSTTTFTVTGTDSTCRGFAFAKITVNPLPLVPTIQLVDDSLVSNATFGNQWYSIANGLIPDAVSAYYKPSVSGYYYVIVTDSNGCISDSSNHVYYNTQSIQDFSKDALVVIAPNPNDGRFTILFRGTAPQKVVIGIVNSLGVAVFSHTYHSTTEVKIDLGQIPSGVYSVIVFDPSASCTHKLVIFNP